MPAVPVKKSRIVPVHLNKKALFDYEVLGSYEAGIKLTGAEVKSVRGGRVNLKGAFVSFVGGRAKLLKAHISHYKCAAEEGAPDRPRDLLLHKKDIASLKSKSDEDGCTVIPVEVYLKGSLVKVRVALARGRKKWDKRALLKGRDEQRHQDVELKRKDW